MRAGIVQTRGNHLNALKVAEIPPPERLKEWVIIVKPYIFRRSTADEKYGDVTVPVRHTLHLHYKLTPTVLVLHT